MYNFVLSETPVSKKNGKQIINRGGRTYLIPSNSHKTWHDNAGHELSIQTSQLRGIDLSMGKIRLIEIKFQMGNKYRKDLDNLATSILDLLVDHGIIHDDSIFYVPELSLKYTGYVKDKPCTVITIHTL